MNEIIKIELKGHRKTRIAIDLTQAEFMAKIEEMEGNDFYPQEIVVKNGVIYMIVFSKPIDLSDVQGPRYLMVNER